VVSLCSVFFIKIDRMPYFDIRNSVFDIRFLKFLIRSDWPLFRPEAR
jgi:hypothetical protein